MKGKLGIRISAPYRKWFNGKAHLELEVDEGMRLEEVLSLLAARYPSLRPALGLDEEALWGRVIILQNDRLLRRDDVLSPEGEIEILPPVAGGKPERRSCYDARRLLRQNLACKPDGRGNPRAKAR